MKTIGIITLIIVSFFIMLSSNAFAVPYISSQERYFNSDIVLIGKITAATPISPTHTKFEIKVEQYLKNPQPQDNMTVIAAKTNKTSGLGITTEPDFEIGQRVFLYLKTDQGNYVALWYSHLADSLCDPPPTLDDMNFQPPKGIGFDEVPGYTPLRVEATESDSYLFAVNQPVIIKYDAWNDYYTIKTFDVKFLVQNDVDSKVMLDDTKQIDLKPCIGHQTVTATFVPKLAGRYEVTVVFDGSLMGSTFDIPNSTSNLEIPFQVTNSEKNLENENSPLIITQVELDSPFLLMPQNQTCTLPARQGFINNCLTDLIPGHNVQCAYFLGSGTCEPRHQYTGGTNKACLDPNEIPRAPQWFDLYNTQNKTIQIQLFNVQTLQNMKPWGEESHLPVPITLGPYDKCTYGFGPIDEPLTLDQTNMSFTVSYAYDGKNHTAFSIPLTDLYNDSRTWQYDGNKWTFADQNTVTVPEFPFVVPIFLISFAAVIVSYRMKFRK